jgi:hypothetical protein
VDGIGTLQFGSTLDLSGTTTMEIARVSDTTNHDQVVVLGTVTYGGTIIVTNVGAELLQEGDTFQLFNAATRAGAFAEIILPALPAGLAWSNRLALDGSLAVVPAINTTPAPIQFVVNGDTLELSWPADRTG